MNLRWGVQRKTLPLRLPVIHGIHPVCRVVQVAVLWRQLLQEGSWTGEMWDKYGKSVLTNVKFFPSYIEPRIFSFDKRYLDRDYAIKYRFTRRNGNVWVGTYESRPTGKCVSRCVLTEVTGDDFFDNTAAIEMVSKQEKSSRKGDEKKSHSKNHTS